VIVIGTRGSALALAQTRLVADALGGEVELRTISTAGDRSDKPIAELGDGAFVTAIEDALRSGEIDLAVHSLKDLPTDDRPGLTIAAILERADPRDVLITRSRGGLATLPQGAVVGTSSPRRAAFISVLRPDVALREIRGNVDTRLRKVREGDYDAAVLALAGLTRLGLEVAPEEILPLEDFPPAPGQGALAIQCRSDDPSTVALASALDHAESRAAVNAERVLLREMGASCEIPLGAWARVEDGEIVLEAALVTGTFIARTEQRGSDPTDLGRRAAAALRSASPPERLSGTVILTRERADEALRAALRERGLDVIELPCVRVEPLRDERPLANALRELRAKDLLVLTSVAGVNAVQIATRGSAIRAPVAAVGPNTAAAARAAGFDVVFVGGGDGRSLGAELPLPAGDVLLARSDRALRDLPEILRVRGARVREVAAYVTVVEADSYRAAAAVEAVRTTRTCALITSPSALEGLLDAVSKERLAAIPLVAIGPSTAAAIQGSLGVEPVVAASTRTGDLVRAVARAMARRMEVVA
jgi:hydroxymethylbilane synthase